MSHITRETYRSAQRAFTLVEAVVSLLIVSTMLVAALSTVGASRLSQYTITEYSRGQLLAEALMAEILQQDYSDPNDTPVFGPESGESTTTRADFDDVDDYNGWVSSPPEQQDGTQISGLAGWERSITIQWVNPDDVTQVQGSESNTKRVTVDVSCNDKKVASLVAIRTNHGL
jgi:MSHA pilin protein MshD